MTMVGAEDSGNIADGAGGTRAGAKGLTSVAGAGAMGGTGRGTEGVRRPGSRRARSALAPA